MPHTRAERLSSSFSKFFATSGALYCGIAITALWMLSWIASKQFHDLLMEVITLVSFLTIFVFQRSQSKEMKALQIKLDELIASSDTASNRMIKAEEAPEHVLDQVHEIYKDAAKAAMDADLMFGTINTSNAGALMETLHDDLVEAEQISAALVDVFTPDEAVLSE